jgi:hypothetical protein
VPDTIDFSIIDRKDWVAVQELIAEVHQAQRMIPRYAVGVHLWAVAVRLFRKIEHQQLFVQTPGTNDLKVHKAFLHELLSLGQMLEIRIENIDDEDLAAFDIRRENLSAQVQELQDTFHMWHGPEIDPKRAAELEKAIFGGAS